MKTFFLCLTTVHFFFVPKTSHATITIDSVSTTISTCYNNGTATLYANSSLSGGLFYAIVSGPVLSPVQNSNVFASLYPGFYTARVYDVNFDSLDAQFNIGGNYQLPAFDLLSINPTCSGFTDGSISAVVDSTSGLSPYTYQVIAPFTGPATSQGFFTGLTDGNYQIRLTDACGSYQTRSSTLISSGTGLDAFPQQLLPYFIKVGCDTFVVSFYYYVYPYKGTLPYTLTYNTAQGPITKQTNPQPIDTSALSILWLYSITDTITNITYGDYCQVLLTDICGVSVYSVYDTIAPFDWGLGFTGTSVNCVATFTGVLQLNQIPSYPYHTILAASPVSFTLLDLSTNQIVDSMTCMQCNPQLQAHTPGNSYLLTVTDGCGQVWQQTINWPSAGAPLVNVYGLPGCRDSTASLQFEPKGFQSATTLFFISGPVYGQSTKAHFEHSDSITYPKIFNQYLPCCIVVKDCPAGTYVFEVSDSCGNLVQGTLTIEPFMLSSLNYSWNIKPSCLNDNTLFYNFNEGTPNAIYAQISGVGNNYFNGFVPTSTPDSITNLNVGKYALEIHYLTHNGSGMYFDGSMFDSDPDCWIVYDTITIAPYTNSTFLTNNTIYCNGTNYVELIPDSSRGVPPYQFSIISGPQTFPLQDSAVFQIQQFGNYVISMEDDCGNNFIQQITVSSDSFPPIVKVGFFCDGSYAAVSGVSSAYFSYIWQAPNGNLIYGDSLIFNPFTAGDTGLYHVSKIVSINGCNDTLHADYYIPSVDSVVQSLLVCQGDSVMIGNMVYYLPGTYRDTLITSSGCDSLVITTLAFSPLPVDSNTVTICYGDSILVGTNYYSVPGVFNDTIPDSGFCKKIMVTQLSVITIIDSLSVTICPGDSLFIGNIIHLQEGVFNDTLTSAGGCDSIIVLNLSFKAIMPVEITSAVDTVDTGVPFDLNAGNNFALNYYWYGLAQFAHNDSSFTSAIIDSPQWIYLQVTDTNGCTVIDSVLIFTREIVADSCNDEFDLIVPNVFTPNDDGVNDYFVAKTNNVSITDVMVYNRWGKIVSEKNATSFLWDGRDDRNHACSAGVYYYTILYKSCNDGKIKNRKGNVILMR